MGNDSTVVFQGLAAFLMQLAPGVAASFYGSMSGYYIAKFNDRTFYIHMLLCHCGPQPFVSLTQKHFDAYFDERFSTRITYPFRVMGTQLILGASIVCWMFVPETKATVLAIGFWLSTVGATIVSSSSQMVSAMDPGYMIYARLGMHMASIVSTVVMVCSGFQPSSSQAELRLVLLTGVGICILVASILFYFHAATDTFTKAYNRLSYDLPTQQDVHEGMTRQITETTPLESSQAKHGVPSWVNIWLVGNGLAMGIEFYVAALVGWFGDPSTAQTLTLIRLCLNLVGRVAAFPIPYLSAFKDGPWHPVMAGCISLTVVLGFMCVSKAFGAWWCSMGLFLISWCAIPIIRTFTSSLVDITAQSYVEVKDRKSVARFTEMSCFFSVLIGLIAGQATGGILNHVNPQGGSGTSLHVHAYLLGMLFSELSPFSSGPVAV